MTIDTQHPHRGECILLATPRIQPHTVTVLGTETEVLWPKPRRALSVTQTRTIAQIFRFRECHEDGLRRRTVRALIEHGLALRTRHVLRLTPLGILVAEALAARGDGHLEQRGVALALNSRLSPNFASHDLAPESERRVDGVLEMVRTFTVSELAALHARIIFLMTKREETAASKEAPATDPPKRKVRRRLKYVDLAMQAIAAAPHGLTVIEIATAIGQSVKGAHSTLHWLKTSRSGDIFRDDEGRWALSANGVNVQPRPTIRATILDVMRTAREPLRTPQIVALVKMTMPNVVISSVQGEVSRLTAEGALVDVGSGGRGGRYRLAKPHA